MWQGEACGVGGRSGRAVEQLSGRAVEQFLCSLPTVRALGAPGKDGVVLAAMVERNLRMQRCRSFALSLLDRCPSPGTGDDAPSAHEVLRDDKFAWGHPRLVSVDKCFCSYLSFALDTFLSQQHPKKMEACCFPTCCFSVRQGEARSRFHNCWNVAKFQRGQWSELVRTILAEEAHNASCRNRWRMFHVAHKGLCGVCWMGLFAARQVFEGAETAPGTEGKR